jgi:hypothetical protein
MPGSSSLDFISSNEQPCSQVMNDKPLLLIHLHDV